MMKYRTWMKRLCVLLIAGCMTLSSIPLSTYADPTDTEVDASEIFEIPEDAIYLSTPEDVLALAENCIDDVWSIGKFVVLNNDIDMTDVDFASIPTFGGVFLGQGYTISGIHMNRDMTAMGFFRYLQKTAVVDNVRMEALVESDGTNDQIGGFVGVNRGLISNCTFVGLVSGTNQIGGIAGWNKTSGIITNCEVQGVVYGSRYIGGIVGKNQGVIRNCVNAAKVNTEVDQNSIPLDLSEGLSLEMELSLDMDMSNFEEKSMSDYATDIGGIAGTSSGVIRECTNNEKVGYQKMGYNIGGIVGSQNGYVAECINNAEINGMDGVGGIVGYFKPSVVLEFGPNPMDTMSAQMNSMMSSMENLMTMPSIDGVDMESIEEALDILQDTEGEIDEDTINAALNDLSDAFGNIYNADYDPTTKVDELKSTMQGMMGSMGSMSMSMEFNIVDVSKDDTENDTIAKVANCVNYGEVKGQTHIAGITGLADMEMTSLLEAMGQESQMSNSADLIVRLVIRNCKNHATISANKNYVGGIVGEMVFGAVIDSKNVGNLDAISANYVGGIAGSCETAIMNSFSKAIIAGADYVGGIAGYGIEVTDCYAFSDIAAYTKFAGGILGSTNELPDETDGLIQNTYYYYVGTDLGGIDGINYEGATGRISFEEFVALENLDDMFKTVDVRFVVDGQEDVVLTIDLGRDVELEDVPIVEVSEADRYDWEYVKPVTSKILGMNEVEEIYYLSENRLSHIYFDQTYQAVIDAKHMVSEGTNTTADGRKVVLAVGAFDQATTVTLTDVLKQNPEVNGVPVIENWQVSISNIGVEKLHYRIPEGVDAENLVLYVRDQQGNWSEREFSVEASFMIFAFSDNEFGFALEERADYSMMITIGVGVVVAGLLLIILKKKFSKSKSKKNEKVA